MLQYMVGHFSKFDLFTLIVALKSRQKFVQNCGNRQKLNLKTTLATIRGKVLETVYSNVRTVSSCTFSNIFDLSDLDCSTYAQQGCRMKRGCSLPSDMFFPDLANGCFNMNNSLITSYAKFNNIEWLALIT